MTFVRNLITANEEARLRRYVTEITEDSSQTVCDSATLNLHRDFDVPVKKLRRREMKWMHMIKAWDKFVTRNYEKLPGDEKIVDEIQRDIHRQFPTHEMFAEQGGSGQSELFNVLKAYSLFNKRDGYCQAHAPLAATLLMQMPSEQAFLCLTSLCNNYLPLYFAPDLQMLQVDAELLMTLLKKTEPAIYKHLKRQGITPILFMTDWFMCIFTRNLPWETVLRVWDMFFCEGRKVLFRVGLTILRLVLEPASVRKECPSMHETVTRLRNIPTRLVETKFFISEMARLKLSEQELSIGFQRHWAIFESKKADSSHGSASGDVNLPKPGKSGISREKKESGHSAEISVASTVSGMSAKFGRYYGKRTDHFAESEVVKSFPREDVFYLCRDLIIGLDLLKESEKQGDAIFGKVCDYFLQIQTRNCSHDHGQTAAFIAFIATFSSSRHIGGIHPCVQQISACAQIRPAQFLNLVRKAKLGSSFARLARDPRLAAIIEEESFQFLRSFEEGREEADALDLLYFIDRVGELLVDFFSTVCLDRFIAELIRLSHLPMTILVTMRLVRKILESVQRRVIGDSEVFGVRNSFLDGIFAEKKLHHSAGDASADLLGLLKIVQIVEEKHTIAGFLKSSYELPWCSRDSVEQGEDFVLELLQLVDYVLYFAINVLDISLESGHLDRNVEKPFFSVASLLFPLSNSDSSIIGQDPRKALEVLKTVDPLCQELIIVELLKNPRTYEDQLVCRDVLKAGIKNQAAITLEKTRFILSALKQVKELAEVCRKILWDSLTELKVEELLSLGQEFNDVSALKGNEFDQVMTVTWNRITEANVDQYLKILLTACLCDAHSVISASILNGCEKPGRVAVTALVLSELGTLCLIPSPDGTSSNLLLSLMVSWTRSCEAVDLKRRSNFCNLLVRLVDVGTLRLVDVLDELIQPEFERMKIPEVTEPPEFPLEIIQAVLDNCSTLRKSAEPWRILQILVRALDHSDTTFSERSTCNVGSIFSGDILDRLWRAFRSTAEMLASSEEEEWENFRKQIGSEKYSNVSLPWISVFCPVVDNGIGQISCSKNGVLKELHKIYFLRHGGVCRECGSAWPNETNEIVNLSLALLVSRRENWSYCFRDFFGTNGELQGKEVMNLIRSLTSVLRWSSEEEQVFVLDNLAFQFQEKFILQLPSVSRDFTIEGILLILSDFSNIMGEFSAFALSKSLGLRVLIDAAVFVLKAAEEKSFTPATRLRKALLACLAHMTSSSDVCRTRSGLAVFLDIFGSLQVPEGLDPNHGSLSTIREKLFPEEVLDRLDKSIDRFCGEYSLESNVAVPAGSMTMGAPYTMKNMPKDGLIVMTMLKEAGVQEYEPRVVNQLLEFVYKYTTDVLEDARLYSHHARKKAVDAEDVKLALRMYLSNTFVCPPPKELLVELSKVRNATPLANMKPHCGPRLPPDRYCQFASNYRMVSNAAAVPYRKGPPKPFTMGLLASSQKEKRFQMKSELLSEDGRGMKRPHVEDEDDFADESSNVSGGEAFQNFTPENSMKMEEADDEYD
ncbi:unnamed protein product [Notodromas monacha]|uniref:Rab-GAP TBC domain-containing protein n=1 Tax=Notodromas monacha TaxID=399045 RepID=A0A7R9GBK2_9CRUS|nr:unnamed protein product [Notodromas monacha]CAG0914891.1 unnamed protein product [Notodromas monacha]